MGIMAHVAYNMLICVLDVHDKPMVCFQYEYSCDFPNLPEVINKIAPFLPTNCKLITTKIWELSPHTTEYMGHILEYYKF